MLLVVLLVLLIGSVGALVYTLTDRSVDKFGISTGAQDVQKSRDVVQSQARQFMLRVNTYGPDLLAADGTMPKYRASVEELLTAKFKDSFEQSVGIAEQGVQSGVGHTDVVYATGVSSIDQDSADVLVVGSVTVSYPDPSDKTKVKRIDLPPAVFRVVVSLVLTQGSWLVDNYQLVTNPDEPNSPTTVPSFPSTTAPASPTATPSTQSTKKPTKAPTKQPTKPPTKQPTKAPTKQPTRKPGTQPTGAATP